MPPEHLDAALTAARAREFLQHFAECADCRIVLESARETLESYFKSKGSATEL